MIYDEKRKKFQRNFLTLEQVSTLFQPDLQPGNVVYQYTFSSMVQLISMPHP